MKFELCKDGAQNTGEKWNVCSGISYSTDISTQERVVTTNMGNVLDQEIKMGNNALN